MSDDDLIRRGDVASVVRQTLVDAAHRNAGKSGNWPSAFFKAEDYASVAIAALPAVEVLVKAAAQDAREVFVGSCDHTKQAIDYMEQVALASRRRKALSVAPHQDGPATIYLTEVDYEDPDFPLVWASASADSGGFPYHRAGAVEALVKAAEEAAEVIHKAYVSATMEAVNAGPSHPLKDNIDKWRVRCLRAEEALRAALTTENPTND